MELPPSVAGLPVQHLQLRDFTARAAARLRTIGAIAEALQTGDVEAHVHHAAARKELTAALADLRACVRRDGTVDFVRFYTARPVRNTCGRMYFVSERLEQLMPKIGDMPIGMLQLRIQTAGLLLKLRISTVARLVGAVREGLPISPRPKQRHVAELVPRLTALAMFTADEGTVDWNSFAKHLRIPIAGCGSAADYGENFLPQFYAAIAAAVRFQFGDNAHLVVTRRLLMPHDSRSKLADIGQLTGITREGVRVWEATVLADLRRIIWQNDYTNWHCRLPDEFRCRVAGFLKKFSVPDRSVYLRDEWKAAGRKCFSLDDSSTLAETRLLTELVDLKPCSLGGESTWNVLTAERNRLNAIKEARALVNTVLTVGCPDGLPLSKLRKVARAGPGNAALSAHDVRCLIDSLPHIEYDGGSGRYRVTKSKLRLCDAFEQTLRRARRPVSLRAFQQMFRDDCGRPRWEIENITNEVSKDSRFVAVARSGKRALREWAEIETRSIVDIAAEIVQAAPGPVSQAQLFAAISQRRPLHPKSIRKLLLLDRRFKRVRMGWWAPAG